MDPAGAITAMPDYGLSFPGPNADDTLATPLVKPGHWVTVAHDLKANNRDVQAELRTMSTDRTAFTWPCLKRGLNASPAARCIPS